AGLSPQASQALGTLPALRAFGEEDRERLMALFREECHPKGTVVFNEGDVARTVYLVASGELRVTSGGSPIAHLGPGELFGEMALLTGERRSATVEVTLDCRLVVLDAEPFLQLLADHPAVYDQFVCLLSPRVSRASSPARARRGYEVVFVDDRSRWPDARPFVTLLAASVERQLGRPVAILRVADDGAGSDDGDGELVLRVDRLHASA